MEEPFVGQKLMKTKSLSQRCWLVCSLMINFLPLLPGNPRQKDNLTAASYCGPIQLGRQGQAHPGPIS